MKTSSKLFLFCAILGFATTILSFLEAHDSLFNEGKMFSEGFWSIYNVVNEYFFPLLLYTAILLYLWVTSSFMPIRKYLIVYVVFSVLQYIFWIRFKSELVDPYNQNQALRMANFFLHFMKLLFEILLFTGIMKYCKKFSVIWFTSLAIILFSLFSSLLPILRSAIGILPSKDHLMFEYSIGSLKSFFYSLLYLFISRFLKPNSTLPLSTKAN